VTSSVRRIIYTSSAAQFPLRVNRVVSTVVRPLPVCPMNGHSQTAPACRKSATSGNSWHRQYRNQIENVAWANVSIWTLFGAATTASITICSAVPRSVQPKP